MLKKQKTQLLLRHPLERVTKLVMHPVVKKKKDFNSLKINQQQFLTNDETPLCHLMMSEQHLKLPVGKKMLIKTRC